MDGKEVYTDKEASRFLRISQVTLWRERKRGRITFRRVASKIVYLREDLENYLERNKREAFGVASDPEPEPARSRLKGGDRDGR